MTNTDDDKNLNPRELEHPGVGVAGDEGLSTGEPGAGTERNQAAPLPRLNLTESGDVAGATSTHHGAGGDFTHTGGVGTAPNEVE
ncbi:MAG: hypothetical protein ACRD9R_07230 [Pyrinomonadaceae bacterium]